MEWLSYSRLQTGDWSGSLSLLKDLYTSQNLYSSISNHYLQFAYRTHARPIIELFHWFPYDSQFVNVTQQFSDYFNESQIATLGNDNTTEWYPIWSEAGLRFSKNMFTFLFLLIIMLV